MHRFYWLVDGVLAGCSLPGGDPRSSAHANLLEIDLQWLSTQGIGAVLSLTETPLDEEITGRHELNVLHVPVIDMTAPHPGQIAESLRFIDWQRMEGRAVVVHCLQGQGRTGTILAAFLIRDGMEPDAAIAHMREICPGALEAPTQPEALRAFAQRRDWVL